MTTLYHTLFVDRMYSLEHNNMTAAPVIKGNTSGFLPEPRFRFQNGGCVKSAYTVWQTQAYNVYNSYVKTSRVTRVTLVLWIGNETLRSFTLRERPLRNRVWNPYRIMPIHWLMARRRLWRNDVVRSYWRTRHPLLRFLCRKEPCRQREELGSKRSVSFPIQRTRVTRVTRDVLFHR